MTLGPANRPLRVLVADDSPDTCASLRLLLELWGHEVREATDGPTALALAQSFRPDVALLDIGLPKLDGYELAGRLRELPGLEGICLIATTGRGTEADVARAKAAGFQHHLLKPFELTELERLVLNCHASATNG